MQHYQNIPYSNQHSSIAGKKQAKKQCLAQFVMTSAIKESSEKGIEVKRTQLL